MKSKLRTIMKNQVRPIILFFTGGFFLILDQIFKLIAISIPKEKFYLWKPYLGWEITTNKGIAFGLPFPSFLILIITPIILIFLIYYLIKNPKKNNFLFLGIFLIIFGATSNFIDRLLFSATIDYWRLFTSIINLADVMITIGAGLLIFSETKKTVTDND